MNNRNCATWANRPWALANES